jgi:replicative DNA helicase
MEDLISLNIERTCLGSLFKYPDLWYEVCTTVDNDCFQDEDGVHKIVFTTLRKYLDKSEKFDKVIIANDIKNTGVRTGEIDIFEYCNILAATQINKPGALKAFTELVKLKICRDLVKQTDAAKDFILHNKDKEVREIVAGVDFINNEKINTYETKDDPADLFGGIVELVEKRGENPVETVGILTGFKEFDNVTGGIRAGNGFYSIASRAKHNKSTMLLNIAQKVVILNKDIKVLILDTEMQTEVSQFRGASAMTNVPMWYLETGNWKKNPEYEKRVKQNLDYAKQFKEKIFHMNVVNRPISDICSLVRRWYFKFVGRGGKALLIYDYLKLTNEKVSSHWSEHQVLGDKANHLNELGNKLNIGIFTAMQSNREAENGRDDSAIVAGSDRMLWFCAYLGIFRKKTMDELAEEGLQFGTHKLIHIAGRFQGKDDNDYFSPVNVGTKKKPKYQRNFINYNVVNFKVDECGTLKDIVAANKELKELEEDEPSGLLS